MYYNTLGDSKLRVSALSLGVWQLGDPGFWGDDECSKAEDLVAAAIDHGITLFDTAELYGNGCSEEILGSALKGRRDEVLIASKVSTQHCTAEGVRAACENSLNRLQTDRIDLYQIHWPFPTEDFEGVQDSLEKLRAEGKIVEVGISNFGRRNIRDWMATGQAVSNQIGYNMLFRAPEYEMIPACQKNKLGVLAYMPLMQGLLSGRYASIEDIPFQRRRTRHFSCTREGTRHGQVSHEKILWDTLEDLSDFAEAIGVPLAVLSLCWLMRQPGLSSVIIGSRKVEQLLFNLQAVNLDIGPAATAQLNEATYPLKVALGKNCDMWESDDNQRIF
jgi:aryl-alcohol dehydrogenase-like predicted oxidoreductase